MNIHTVQYKGPVLLLCLIAWRVLWTNARAAAPSVEQTPCVVMDLQAAGTP